MFKKKNQKLAGLWLAGEVVNHVGIYGSKAAEGLSAFQHRSCVVYISYFHVDGWVQDCSNSIASTLELLQSYTKPSMWSYIYLEYSIDTGVINVHY